VPPTRQERRKAILNIKDEVLGGKAKPAGLEKH